MPSPGDFTRRGFLQAGLAAGSGLILALRWPVHPEPPASPSADGLAPNAFLQVTSDGMVTVWVSKSEMGQGVMTALPMILADELEVEWSRVRTRQADAEAKYGSMGTGGSTSVSTLWLPLRKAGAQAREMLVSAAAARWAVGPSECHAELGSVVHGPSRRRLGYGELVEAASALPVPETPTLKQPSEFRLIGKPTPRLDAPAKVTGQARFGLDLVVPGMRYAVIVRCPVLGGKLQGFDGTRARAVRGVLDVVKISNGVAVVADSTWAAIEGSRALECRWDEPAGGRLDSTGISRMLRGLAGRPGAVARDDGDAARALASSGRLLSAEYEVPFLAHAPMEPMNCVADVGPDRCEVWAPSQSPQQGLAEVARALDMKPEQVTFHVTLMGGAFGRRLLNDYAVEVAEVSRAVKAPVKLTWTREDDMRHGWYRPASVNRLSAALDGDGRPLAWMHRVATPSIGAQRRPGSLKGGLDRGAVDGAADLPYDIASVRVEFCLADTPVPVSWWRSVYASQNVFATECFADEVARAAGMDPLQFRRQFLSQRPRELAVVNLAAEKADWMRPRPEGYGLGMAVHHFFSDTVVAEVAEVSVGKDRQVRVHRVVCAVDCGTVVNPDGVRAQIEGGVIYGLTAALKGEITLEGGRVRQSNFHDYPVLRINEVPEIEVYLVPSTEPPKGVGEPAVPPIAPAVANAVFAATGKRVRKLPIRL